MKSVSLDSKINMKGVEHKRTYFFKNNKKIVLNKPLNLIINKDNSHSFELENGFSIEVENNWLAFSAETPINDFSFNVNADNDEWTDISHEVNRVNFFEGLTYLIENPLKINIRSSGSQSIVDKQGKIHYISKHFI